MSTAARNARVAMAVHGWATVELARRLGVTRSAVTKRLAADEWSDHGPSGITRAAAALGVPADVLRDGTILDVTLHAVQAHGANGFSP